MPGMCLGTIRVVDYLLRIESSLVCRQLSTTDKVAMERRIQDHKRGLKEYVEPKDDSDDDSESATPIPQSQMAGQHSPRRETSGARGCCTIL